MTASSADTSLPSSQLASPLLAPPLLPSPQSKLSVSFGDHMQTPQLSDKQSEKSYYSDRSSADLSSVESKKSAAAHSEKSAEKKSRRKSGEGAPPPPQANRRSLYKPLQKIYSFKSKFTEKKICKAQDKLSEKKGKTTPAAGRQESINQSLSESNLDKASTTSGSLDRSCLKDRSFVEKDRSFLEKDRSFPEKDSDQSSDISTVYSGAAARTLPKTKGQQHLISEYDVILRYIILFGVLL